jgi:hypothetical protein
MFAAFDRDSLNDQTKLDYNKPHALVVTHSVGTTEMDGASPLAAVLVAALAPVHETDGVSVMVTSFGKTSMATTASLVSPLASPFPLLVAALWRTY